MKNQSRKNQISKFLVVLCGVVILSFVGCGKKEDDYAPGTFGAVYNQTLKTACIECHRPGGAATDQYNVQLDFTTQATAYSTLTTKYVTGSTSVGSCGSAKIVQASDVTRSYLAVVLIQDYYNSNNISCSPYNLHLSDQNLSTAEQESLVQWIQSGALNN